MLRCFFGKHKWKYTDVVLHERETTSKRILLNLGVFKTFECLRCLRVKVESETLYFPSKHNIDHYIKKFKKGNSEIKIIIIRGEKS